MTSVPTKRTQGEPPHDDRASRANALITASVKWVAAIGGILTAAGVAGLGPLMAMVGVGAVCFIAALTIWAVSRI